MYYDLRDRYWWPGMEKDIAEYVSKCLTCLKVKAEHQRPSGLLQQPDIPVWKWEGIALDFVTKFHRTSSGHHIIWVIVDRLTKSTHFLPMREDYKMERKCRSPIMRAEVREGQLIGPELVQETTEKISCGTLWEEREVSIASRFVETFEIIKKVGTVAYRLYLLEELNGIHDTFHVSNLKKCLADPTLKVHLDEIRVDAKLNFVEEPVKILEREFKKLKRIRIPIVKVRWNSKHGPEFTWERADKMKLKRPSRLSRRRRENPDVVAASSFTESVSLWRLRPDAVTKILTWSLYGPDGVSRIQDVVSTPWIISSWTFLDPKEYAFGDPKDATVPGGELAEDVVDV
nr:putative reverse transcriptase domain-containing protein [Tanacetum cinerariifolium]